MGSVGVLHSTWRGRLDRRPLPSRAPALRLGQNCNHNSLGEKCFALHRRSTEQTTAKHLFLFIEHKSRCVGGCHGQGGAGKRVFPSVDKLLRPPYPASWPSRQRKSGVGWGEREDVACSEWRDACRSLSSHGCSRVRSRDGASREFLDRGAVGRGTHEAAGWRRATQAHTRG